MIAYGSIGSCIIIGYEVDGRFVSNITELMISRLGYMT